MRVPEEEGWGLGIVARGHGRGRDTRMFAVSVKDLRRAVTAVNSEEALINGKPVYATIHFALAHPPSTSLSFSIPHTCVSTPSLH